MLTASIAPATPGKAELKFVDAGGQSARSSIIAGRDCVTLG
jgi:hypothetical protein